MNADLVHAPGVDTDLEQRRPSSEEIDRSELATRLLTPRLNADMPLTAAPFVGDKRGGDQSCLSLPSARDKREITLFDLTFPEEFVELPQRTTLLGNDEATARTSVEPVSEFQEGGIGTQRPQRLDDPELEAATAVYSEPARFVERKGAIILENDALVEPAEISGGTRRRGSRSHGRNTDLVARYEPIQGLAAPSVNPHLAGPNEPIYMALWHALELCEKKVVQALACTFVRDYQLLDLSACG